jgi:hypothetical protein
MYVKIIDRGECFSTTMEFIDGVYANRTEWAKYNFYPQNDMVGELVKRTPSAYIIKIKDGIYVPMTKRGIKEISYEEFLAGQVNNVCSGMDERQQRINAQLDDLNARTGHVWQTLPDMRNAFRTDIIQNITKLTCDFKRKIFLPDVKESFVMYATDMCLEFEKKSGRDINTDRIKEIANQVGDVYMELFEDDFDEDDKNECINRTITLTNNPNARDIIDRYYHNVNMRWSWS